jgi:hypothetical protein
LIEKQLKQKAVAERLGLTARQARRLVERYEVEGPQGLISKLRERPGNRRLKPERAKKAFAITRARYGDFDQLWRPKSSESGMGSTCGRDRQVANDRRRPMVATKTAAAQGPAATISPSSHR